MEIQEFEFAEPTAPATLIPFNDSHLNTVQTLQVVNSGIVVGRIIAISAEFVIIDTLRGTPSKEIVVFKERIEGVLFTDPEPTVEVNGQVVANGIHPDMVHNSKNLFVPSFVHHRGYSTITRSPAKHAQELLSKRLVYTNKEEAAARGKAMMLTKKVEVINGSEGTDCI